MNRNKNKAFKLLSIFIFLLIAICGIVLTINFIKPPPYEEESTMVTEPISEKPQKDGNEEQKGNSSGNLVQHNYGSDKFGLVASNNKDIFKYQIKNKTPCLTRTNIKTEEEDIILTGYPVKSLNLIKNKLYMILEQIEDNKTYQVIAYMDITNNSITPINTTKATEIYSFVSDGENLYYTIKNDNAIYKADKDYAITKIGYSNSKGDTPFLFGIKEGKLYYVNGIEMCTIGIQTNQIEVISYQYCSIEQYPMLTNSGIISFYNLAHSQIDLIGFDGIYLKTLVSEDIKTYPHGIDSINFSSGYLFFKANESIFYLDKEGNTQELKDIDSGTENIFLTDEYIVFEKTKNNTALFSKIIWLLSA